MEKRLISSYDEESDTFVGKVVGEHGYIADYGISDDIFLNIDKNNMPTSVFVRNASEVFNVSGKSLQDGNVRICISCNDECLSFRMFVENSEICSLRRRNDFGIPASQYLMDCNI